MSDELVKRWDDHVESMCGPMSVVEHMAQKMRNRIEQLTAERDRFSSTVDTLERLRPHWAQGYSSDSMAAQASTAALAGIWEILGVSDQTSAVAALKELTAERDRLKKALEDLIADCEADYPPSHGAIKYAAKLALKGETK
jgi:hypothetical protein